MVPVKALFALLPYFDDSERGLEIMFDLPFSFTVSMLFSISFFMLHINRVAVRSAPQTNMLISILIIPFMVIAGKYFTIDACYYTIIIASAAIGALLGHSVVCSSKLGSALDREAVALVSYGGTCCAVLINLLNLGLLWLIGAEEGYLLFKESLILALILAMYLTFSFAVQNWLSSHPPFLERIQKTKPTMVFTRNTLKISTKFIWNHSDIVFASVMLGAISYSIMIPLYVNQFLLFLLK